ncbi:MAG: transcription antitermination factor NusB [Pseudomonadales bacterium]|nr:transcription antitermination factor NusB [Pseudomonadales bacterium]
MSEGSKKKTNVWARRRARRALVQALYQWELSANSVSSVIADFQTGDALKKADDEFFTEILRRSTDTTDVLDALYAPLLDREVNKLDPVERAILRLAAFEFSERIDVPYRVVIDEYVELAKVFGAQDSHKYINGVLDNLASSVRTVEVGSRG